MKTLADYQSYADAQMQFSPERLWELFDGHRESLNIAHECVDRHAASGRDALIVLQAQGGEEVITYAELSQDSSRFAHWLEAEGVRAGERVAIMLEPSRAFYTAMFGVIKRGAIAVPLFTLFGPDGIRLRVNDCAPKILLTNQDKAEMSAGIDGVDVVIADAAFMQQLNTYSDAFDTHTRADDYAIFQYTSGTTRELPAAVKHVRVIASFAHRRQPGGTAYGMARWHRWHWASRSAPMQASTTPSASCGHCRMATSTTFRLPPRISG